MRTCICGKHDRSGKWGLSTSHLISGIMTIRMPKPTRKESLAAALVSNAKFDGADISEVVISKAYSVGATFKGKPILKELSGSTFDESQLGDAVFEDTIIIGYIDLQKLCANTSISAEGIAELGCSLQRLCKQNIPSDIENDVWAKETVFCVTFYGLRLCF